MDPPGQSSAGSAQRLSVIGEEANGERLQHAGSVRVKPGLPSFSVVRTLPGQLQEATSSRRLAEDL